MAVNFAMISAYRQARSICGRHKVRREKRYQDGAESGEKKDCEFYDDLDVSADNADIRSSQGKT